MTALLVSVRNAAEAEEAIAGGAAIIDIKEPSRGSLGSADRDVASATIRAVAGRRPISVALGELVDLWGGVPISSPDVAYFKAGLSESEGRFDWRRILGRMQDALPLCGS